MTASYRCLKFEYLSSPSSEIIALKELTIMNNNQNPVVASVLDRFDPAAGQNMLLMQNQFTFDAVVAALPLIEKALPNTNVNVFRIEPIGYGISIKAKKS